MAKIARKPCPMSLSLTQVTALLILLMLLIGGAWGGYRRGPIRQLAGVIALASAILIGWLAGPPLGLWLLTDTSVPWILRESVGIFFVALITWLIALSLLWYLGRRNPDTKESESPVLGAIVGCWTGLLNSAILLALLTTWAGVAETLLKPADAEQHWAVSTRQSLAELPGAGALSGYSPIPHRWQTLFTKFKRVMANPEASRRLMEQEPIRALATHPTFYTAWGDPEIKQLVRQGRLWAVLEHPSSRALLNDEPFQRELLQLDLEAAVDKALK